MSTELDTVKVALDKATDYLCRVESSVDSDAGCNWLFSAEEELINAVRAAHDCHWFDDGEIAWSLIAIAISELRASYSLVRARFKADAAEEMAFLHALKAARERGEDLPDTTACRYSWRMTGQLPVPKTPRLPK